MKLLLDQGLPRSAAEVLRAAGVDATHTAEIGMARASDAEIADRARAEARTVVTLDADFHALLATSNAADPSVIRIRVQGLRGAEIAALVRRVMALCDADLRMGAMVSVDEYNVRIRSLPLVKA